VHLLVPLVITEL